MLRVMRERDAKDMNGFRKWLSLMLSVCLLAGAAAFAEGTTGEVTEAVAVAGTELQADTVLATVNGTDITWGDVQSSYDNLVADYGMAYDMTVSSTVDLFRAVALDTEIMALVMDQKAAELGLDQFSEEEAAGIFAAADADLESAINNYMSMYLGITAEATEEDLTNARAEAEAAFLAMGYSQDAIREMYKKDEILARIQNYVVQDVAMDDLEAQALHLAKVENDKMAFGEDLAAYVQYNAIAAQNGMENAWYKPAGFRAVKHILLSVDQTLVDEYHGLQSILEEQVNEEAAALQGGEVTEVAEVTEETTEDAEPTPEPAPLVTQADVDTAKANILASKAEVIAEINDKIAEGVDFDELIAEYGEDGGMAVEPYKTNGYEVALESAGVQYVASFVDAAFSVESVGDVSAPYLSDYGLHIVKYIADVPEGPVEMTEAARLDWLEDKKEEKYTSDLTSWRDAAQVEYTGVVPSMEELEAQEAEQDEPYDVEDELAEEEPGENEEAPAQ